MLMLNLIIILLIGGAVAWWSERLGNSKPRLIALAFVLTDLAYLLFSVPSFTGESFAMVPRA